MYLKNIMLVEKSKFAADSMCLYYPSQVQEYTKLSSILFRDTYINKLNIKCDESNRMISKVLR